MASEINNNKIYSLYKSMTANNVSLIYTGEFNQTIAKSVLAMTEKKFSNEGINEIVKKKVFNIMVESLQNICKHQQNITNQNATPVFMIGYDGTHFFIISGNPIEKSKIPLIKEKIDLVNSLDLEGLKKHYKEMRLNMAISSVGGAGLGFIDMARKSEGKLEYAFETINDVSSYFTLQLKISDSIGEED